VGEITLRGCCRRNKERTNIKEIILCHENKSDIDEIKSDYLDGLTFHYVKMSEVLQFALNQKKVKNATLGEN
jgi:ATP-dependent Lon protease